MSKIEGKYIVENFSSIIIILNNKAWKRMKDFSQINLLFLCEVALPSYANDATVVQPE